MDLKVNLVAPPAHLIGKMRVRDLDVSQVFAAREASCNPSVPLYDRVLSLAWTILMLSRHG